jgi:proteasome beta subunit
MVALVDAHGYRRLAEDDVAEVVESVVAARQERPDGPQAPLN